MLPKLFKYQEKGFEIVQKFNNNGILESMSVNPGGISLFYENGYFKNLKLQCNAKISKTLDYVGRLSNLKASECEIDITYDRLISSIVFKTNKGIFKQDYGNGNGRLFSQGFVDNSSFIWSYYIGTWYHYFNSGKIHEILTYKSRIEYDFKKYSETGQLFQTGTIVNGKFHGKIIDYYLNGNIMQEYNYFDGRKHGDCIDYSNYGHLEMKKTYFHDDILIEKNDYRVDANKVLKDIKRKKNTEKRKNWNEKSHFKR